MRIPTDDTADSAALRQRSQPVVQLAFSSTRNECVLASDHRRQTLCLTSDRRDSPRNVGATTQQPSVLIQHPISGWCHLLLRVRYQR